MKIHANISSISIFPFLWIYISLPFLSYTRILPMSQLQAQ